MMVNSISRRNKISLLKYNSNRSLSSSSSHTSKCPFTVLGVSKTPMYSEVKQAFIKLALEYHPDTAASTGESSSSQKKSTTEIFFKIRHAFESIRSDDQGNAILVEENIRDLQEQNSSGSSRWTDEEMTAWFQQETGRKLSFYMDEITRQEVIHISKTMSRGGLDRGGMWEMAASLEREERFRKENGKGDPSNKKVPLQVSEGNSRRRTRRRNRER